MPFFNSILHKIEPIVVGLNDILRISSTRTEFPIFLKNRQLKSIPKRSGFNIASILLACLLNKRVFPVISEGFLFRYCRLGFGNEHFCDINPMILDFHP